MVQIIRVGFCKDISYKDTDDAAIDPNSLLFEDGQNILDEQGNDLLDETDPF